MCRMELYISLICLATVNGVHLTINWTHVSTLPLDCETHFKHQPGAHQDLCPCDLTSNFCDLSCCCDGDCTSTSINTSICLSPAGQSQTEGSVLPHTCKYFGPYSPEWHSFFCPMKENTPFLGLFYPHQQVIRDFQKYQALGKQQFYSYQKEDILIPDQEYQPHYVFRSQVLVGEDLGGAVVQGALRLPQPVLDGVCVGTFAVHFLEDLSHECTVIMSPEKCESEPSLSVASYLQPVDGAAPPGLLQVIGNLSSLEFVSASVKYEWLEDVTGFIKVQRGGMPSVLGQSTVASNEGNHLPYFDEPAGQCNNVVLAVQYHMVWEGPAIVDIDATITLGSVSVSPGPREEACATPREHNSTCAVPQASRLPFSSTPQLFLVQRFMVKYHHTYSASNASGDATHFTSDDGEVSILSHLERSGNPGYLVHKPLLAGYVEYNSTGEENSTNSIQPSMTVNPSTGLYVWRPDESGKCHTSHLEKVTFGMDMISSCLFTWPDVIHCSDLRESIEAALYSLVQADTISTLGWYNITSEEDLLPIIFEQHTEDNETSVDDCIIPSSLEYKIIYQDVVNEPRPSLAVHQVVGASVRLRYKKFRLEHNRSAGSRLLTSSAVFCRHARPSGVTRYWKLVEDRWCERGTCWREILWPWTHRWAGTAHWDGSHRLTSLASLLVHSLLMLTLLVPPLVLLFIQGFRLPW